MSEYSSQFPVSHASSATRSDDELATDNSEGSNYFQNPAQPSRQAVLYSPFVHSTQYMATAAHSNHGSQAWQNAHQPAQYGNTTYQQQAMATATATAMYPPYFGQTMATNYASASLISNQRNYVSNPSIYLDPRGSDKGGHRLGTSRSPSSEGTDSVSPSMPSQSGSKKPHGCSEIVDGRTCGSSFKRKADLIRHMRCVHYADTTVMWYCDAPRCDRNEGGLHGGFTRKDHLVEHLRSYHHRDIPKRKRGRGIEEDQPESSTDQQEIYAEQATQQSYYQSPAYPYVTASYPPGSYPTTSYPPNSQ